MFISIINALFYLFTTIIISLFSFFTTTLIKPEEIGICYADKPLTLLESVVTDPFRNLGLPVCMICELEEQLGKTCDGRCVLCHHPPCYQCGVDKGLKIDYSSFHKNKLN